MILLISVDIFQVIKTDNNIEQIFFQRQEGLCC